MGGTFLPWGVETNSGIPFPATGTDPRNPEKVWAPTEHMLRLTLNVRIYVRGKPNVSSDPDCCSGGVDRPLHGNCFLCAGQEARVRTVHVEERANGRRRFCGRHCVSPHRKRPTVCRSEEHTS